MPVRKVEYNAVADGLAYQPDKCPGCTLFGGTVVAQARAPRAQKPLAMVCRTRFYSAKGQLLRSILFPREPEESFISDSLRFICVMLAACMGLYIWAAVVLAQVGASPDRIVVGSGRNGYAQGCCLKCLHYLKRLSTYPASASLCSTAGPLLRHDHNRSATRPARVSDHRHRVLHRAPAQEGHLRHQPRPHHAGRAAGRHLL